MKTIVFDMKSGNWLNGTITRQNKTKNIRFL